MISFIKSTLLKFLPDLIKNRIISIRFNNKLKHIQKDHQKALIKIRKKEKIKVAFFLIHDSIWKYEGVYKLMEQDERFDPVVVVCPYISYGEENMLNDMRTSYNLFKLKGYNVVKSLNEESGEWLDVNKVIQPDIVFFTNPYKLTKNEYFITNYLNTLTCYVPYSFTITHRMDMAYNELAHNFMWKYFCETSIHLGFAQIYSINKGINVYVSGYPGIDIFFDKSKIFNDVWKLRDKKIKRIIWAPHHTIEEDKDVLSFSNFKAFHSLFLEIVEIYKDKIQIAFKPHPLLKPKLYVDKEWGKNKTDFYYESWDLLSNGQLNESAYEDLFMTSDAMIHDSGSFMIEYICTGNPALFTMRDINVKDRLNEFGKLALDNMYQAFDNKDIIYFIEEVIKGNDKMKDSRNYFLSKYIKNMNISASELIYKSIIEEIKN